MTRAIAYIIQTKAQLYYCKLLTAQLRVFQDQIILYIPKWLCFCIRVIVPVLVQKRLDLPLNRLHCVIGNKLQSPYISHM
jgi:hypothetical protein